MARPMENGALLCPLLPFTPGAPSNASENAETPGEPPRLRVRKTPGLPPPVIRARQREEPESAAVVSDHCTCHRVKDEAFEMPFVIEHVIERSGYHIEGLLLWGEIEGRFAQTVA
jgi:hypothetical protein